MYYLNLLKRLPQYRVGNGYLPDIRSQALQLLHNILVAAFNVLDTADLALALGSQGGNDHGGAGPQIAGLDGSAGEMVHTLHHGGLVVHLDGGAHALELVHIAVAAAPDALRHQGGALRQAEDRGHLGLHVRGEAGVGQGLDVGLLELAGAADQEGVLPPERSSRSADPVICRSCLLLYIR